MEARMLGTAGTLVTAGMPTTEKTMFAAAKATIAIKIIQAKVVTAEKQGRQHKLACLGTQENQGASTRC